MGADESKNVKLLLVSSFGLAAILTVQVLACKTYLYKNELATRD